MKNVLKIAALICISGMIWSCSYDDRDLWNKIEEIDSRLESLEQKIEKMNQDITSIQAIVNALNKGKVIMDVETLADGYKLIFSDNTSITIKHGTNGKDGSEGAKGADAPIIGVKADMDGIYYWTQTLNGETSWLLDDKGDKIPVHGKDGANGITPVISIDEEGYWTVDLGNGPEYILDADGNRIKAIPDNDTDLFTDMDEDSSSVTLYLANGTSITIPKLLSLTIGFVDGDNQIIKVGETKQFALTNTNLDYCKMLDITEGWDAKLSYTPVKAISDVMISITAPSALTDSNRNCEIHILVSDEAGNCKLSKLHLTCVEYELRVLTFEDADAKFSPFELDYCGVNISTWSDLIEESQYEGSMTYGDYSSAAYTWWDENNTELMHIFPYNNSAYCYWGGGHVISNYNTKNYSEYGDYNNQLTVFNNAAGNDMSTTGGGHNGSDHFAMHFGYKDNSSFCMVENLPALTFADGEARVIDHLYVNNSTYAINSYMNGNGLSGSIGPEDWVKAVAIGYDADGEKTGETSIYLCNGPDNIVMEWTKWELSSLGKVVSVEFNITGSSDNGYGYSQPAYFAYDDVCVRF